MTGMKFGLSIHGKSPLNNQRGDNFRDIEEQVEAADDAGFDLIYMGHHYFVEQYQKFQNIPALSRLSAFAPDMNICPAILLPLHHPLIIAEQLATMDVFTDGQVVAAPVAGYRDHEFNSLGIDKRERAIRMREGIEIISRVWTSDNVTYHGDIYDFEDVTINPKPVQDPHPPLWIGANQDSAISRASDLGDAWLVNPHEDESEIARQLDLVTCPSGDGLRGYQPARWDVFVAETDKEAINIFGPAVQNAFEDYKSWGQHEAMQNPDAFDQAFDALKDEHFIAGSPDTVASRLAGLVDLGIDCFILKMYLPGIPHSKVLDSIRLFGNEVMPLLYDKYSVH